MNISILEKFKKMTSVIVISTLVFSFVSPTFAAVIPTFVATETVTNVPMGSPLETATHSDVTLNVVEVKASRTLTVSSRPGNGETIKMGQCVITFSNVNSGGVDTNCSDNSATIQRATAGGSTTGITLGDIASSLRAITGVNTGNHGILAVS